MGEPLHAQGPSGESPRVVGRYALCDAIAAGGMATVHIGRLLGPVGFSRTVAIKRLHEQFAQSDEFTAMFLDEARLVARIRHPNVVPTLDIVELGAPRPELFLIMEYVPGESLAKMLRGAYDQGWRVPPRVVASVMAATLHGLHAAHEAKDEQGNPLNIVHRDVSPQNILVGTDGVPRILDFGVAKAAGRMQTTQAGQLKGKLAYMAPEQVRSDTVSRQTDIYAAAICLWEGLTSQRLYTGSSDGAVLAKVLESVVEPPSQAAPRAKFPLDAEAMNDVRRLDAIVMRGLARDPQYRFQNARDMAMSIEQAVRPATGAEIATWVEAAARVALAERALRITRIERDESLLRLAPKDPLASTGDRPVASGPVPTSEAQPQYTPAPGPANHANQASQLRPNLSGSGSHSAYNLPNVPAPDGSSPFVAGRIEKFGPGISGVSNISQISQVSEISQVAPSSPSSPGSPGGHISGLSQLSGIAMTSSAQPGMLPLAKVSRLPVLIAIGATVMGVVLAVVIVAIFRPSAAKDAKKETTLPPSAIGAPGIVTAPLPTAPVPTASTDPSSGTNTGTNTGSSSNPANSPVDSPDTSAHADPAPSAAPSAAPAEHHHHDPCSPPYTTDASGIRHYKPKCI